MSHATMANAIHGNCDFRDLVKHTHKVAYLKNMNISLEALEYFAKDSTLQNKVAASVNINDTLAKQLLNEGCPKTILALAKNESVIGMTKIKAQLKAQKNCVGSVEQNSCKQCFDEGDTKPCLYSQAVKNRKATGN